MTEIRLSIPTYAGHADSAARWKSDQQVRAWVGEALVGLRERLPVDAVAAPFDDLLVHCQFGDQNVLKALEDESFAEPANAARIESEDQRVVSTAARAASVDAAALPQYITELRSSFHDRNAAIVALGRPR